MQKCWISENDNLSQIQLVGYTCICQGKRCSSSGGLIIYADSRYKYELLDIPSEYTGWERQFIKISGDGISKEIIIGNIYRPPKESIEHYLCFINDFSQLLSRLQTNNAEVILAGDFNINILQINEKRIFSQFEDGLTENSFYTKITLPTRFSNKHGTLIDNCMCKLTKCTLNTTAGIFTKRISDHQSYFIFLNTANPKIATPKYIHVNSLNPAAISIFLNGIE